MSAAPSHVPTVAAARDRRYLPLVLVANQEATSRFPEKTGQWWLSQLVCQPRPRSLSTHASRGSVARLEAMADLDWSEQPPARPDHSLYVYYTYAPPAAAAAASPPTYDPASPASASAVPSSFSLSSEEMAYAMEMLDQWNDAAELLEFTDGHAFLALQADGTVVPLPALSPDPLVMDPLSSPTSSYSYASPPTQYQYAPFPPISPPASSLPVPSCVREREQAPGITGEEDYVPRSFRTPNSHAKAPPTIAWPPTSPPASSLPVPSWYAALSLPPPPPVPSIQPTAALLAGGSSKDRAHRQNVMEKRRARRSSPNSTPRPKADRDNIPAAYTAVSSGPSRSTVADGGSSKGASSLPERKRTGGRKRKPLRPLYTFAPRDNFESSPPNPPRPQPQVRTGSSHNSPYMYAAAGSRLIAKPLPSYTTAS